MKPEAVILLRFARSGGVRGSCTGVKSDMRALRRGVPITGRVVLLGAMAFVACNNVPGSGVPNNRLDRKPDVRLEPARPATQPTEALAPLRVGGEVSAPRLLSPAKTLFRPDPRQCYQLGVAVFEGVVDKDGNLRGLKLVKGPDNEFTREARGALEQRVFEPARYRGKPVDVVYHVTINHVPVKKVKGPC
jgi:hypothetical protein